MTDEVEIKNITKNLLGKQYMSDLIDLLICLFTATISYYFLNKDLVQSYTNLKELTSFIYLFYSSIIFLTLSGVTVGNTIFNIKLIFIKNIKISNYYFLLRSIVIALLIYTMPINPLQDILFFILIIIVIFPQKYKKDNYIQYSLLNKILNVSFVALK